MGSRADVCIFRSLWLKTQIHRHCHTWAQHRLNRPKSAQLAPFSVQFFQISRSQSMGSKVDLESSNHLMLSLTRRSVSPIFGMFGVKTPNWRLHVCSGVYSDTFWREGLPASRACYHNSMAAVKRELVGSCPSRIAAREMQTWRAAQLLVSHSKHCGCCCLHSASSLNFCCASEVWNSNFQPTESWAWTRASLAVCCLVQKW